MHLSNKTDLRRLLQVKQVATMVPGLSTSSSLKLAVFNIHDTFKAGNWSSYVFLKLVYLTNHDIFNCVKPTVWLDKHGETCVG